MQWVYDDGGRESAGFKGKTGDCVTRAIAIASGRPYKEIYDRLNELAKSERIGKRKNKISNSRTGVYTQTAKKLLENELGFTWHPTMGIGTGCTVHVKEDELPNGTLVLNLSKHFACVIDGVLHDTYDCSRNGTRCVYGYWYKD